MDQKEGIITHRQKVGKTEGAIKEWQDIYYSLHENHSHRIESYQWIKSLHVVAYIRFVDKSLSWIIIQLFLMLQMSKNIKVMPQGSCPTLWWKASSAIGTIRKSPPRFQSITFSIWVHLTNRPKFTGDTSYKHLMNQLIST